MYFKDYMKVFQDIVKQYLLFITGSSIFNYLNNIFSTHKTYNELIKVYREKQTFLKIKSMKLCNL